MKQTIYSFDWMNIIACVVHFFDPEDGFWKLEIETESVTTNLPCVVDGQMQMVLPGHMVRVSGIRLIKVYDYGFMTFKKEGKNIYYGPDRSESGSEESSASVGENSGPSGASD